VKKLVDPNKISSLLLASLMLLQNREDCLVLSGQERTKLLMKELRSFLGSYSYADAVEVGLLPYMHFRLIAPVIGLADASTISYGLPGTLKTSPHYKPRKNSRSGKQNIINAVKQNDIKCSSF
jgi:hypothetical protein